MYVDRLPDALKGALPAPRRTAAGQAVNAALIIYALCLAAGLGLSSAYWMTGGDYPFGAVRAGSWTVWPKAGSRDADPYTRAVNARTGGIPLGIGEGLVLRAAADDAGRALDARCTYRIGTTAPQARYWSLTLYDGAGRPVDTALKRSSFSSAEVLRGQDGGFTVALSREAESGNWLMMPESGEVSLVLRLYDTPAASAAAALDPRSLPSIVRGECGP
ncbi:MAG TPA: DUF1214 domain-containing protein [Beijerinckiaceae bacterium]